MSRVNIRKWFPFGQVKIKDIIEPNHRYLPRCSECKEKVSKIHSYHKREIRDLNVSDSQVIIELRYRKIHCLRCGIRVEHFDFVCPGCRVTNRMANYIFRLCQFMTVKDVANQVSLSWYQVKSIDKLNLKKLYDDRPIKRLRILSIDEIAIRKHHRYMTVIMNYETGQVIKMVKDRKMKSLEEFFNSLSKNKLAKIKAVVIDMWDPFIKAIKTCCPNAAIVFDLFHVVAAFNRVIDQIRVEEYHKATTLEKSFLKKSRYILLKNPDNLREHERPKLDQILKTNQKLNVTYILKDYLKQLWNYKHVQSAKNFLTYWIKLAHDSEMDKLIQFSNTLKTYSYGILNHCNYSISSAKIEGTNNKIKTLKRKAYGYLDLEYFELKVIHATNHYQLKLR